MPPREEGDPYVLVPYAESFIELQLFAQLFFYHPEIYADTVAIQVLNGTKAESIAGLTKMYLVRYGFNVVNYGNAAATGVEKTRIIPLRNGINDEEVNRNIQILPSLTQGEIMNEVPPEYAPAVWPTEAEVIIELGEDFVDFYEENDELFYLGVY